MIAVPVVLAPALAFAFSLTLAERYASVIELTVGASPFAPVGATSGLDPHYLSSPAAPSTLEAMPRSWQAIVADRTAREVGQLTGAEVFRSVRVSVDPDRRVLLITATAEHPRSAVRLARVFAEEYVTFDREAYSAQITAARGVNRLRLAVTERSGARQNRERLAQRRRALAVLATTGPPPVGRFRAAHPAGTLVSPKPVRNALVALAIGVLAGLGFRCYAERLGWGAGVTCLRISP